MSFLNPNFLWALLAVAIPIIIHLINIRRPKTIYFSNTAFIDEIHNETRTRRNLKQILILLARILTIAMLVFVFAGPYIPAENSDNTNADITYIYIDNSFSMDAENAGGKLIDQARQMAKEIVMNDNASMNYIFVTNNLSGSHRQIINRDMVISSINDCEITPNALSMNDVMLMANTNIPSDKKAVMYVISDMQASFFEGLTTMPNDNINVVMLPLNSVKINNLYIDSCWYESPVHRLNGQELLSVKVVNRSDEDFYEVPMQLYLNDSLKAMTNFNISAGQEVDVDIEYTNTMDGKISARIEISDYPIVYDNKLYFTYSVEKNSRVLVVNATQTNKYLSAIYSGDAETFEYSEISQGSESLNNISASDLVILNGVSELSSGLLAELKKYVANGGSVCLIPSDNINLPSINDFASAFDLGKFSPLRRDASKLYYIDYDNDLYKGVFTRTDKMVNLPNIDKSYDFSLSVSSSSFAVLKLENGNPLLIAGKSGEGKVYLFTCPLQSANDEFMKNAVFVPTMYNIALNSKINGQLYQTIIPDAVVSVRPDEAVPVDLSMRISDDESQEFYVDVRQNSGVLNVFLPNNIYADGFYQLYANDKSVGKFALNYNRVESAQDYLGKKELQKINEENFAGRMSFIQVDYDDFSVAARNLAQGTPLWKYFVLLAFMFIVAEVLLIKFMK